MGSGPPGRTDPDRSTSDAVRLRRCGERARAGRSLHPGVPARDGRAHDAGTTGCAKPGQRMGPASGTLASTCAAGCRDTRTACEHSGRSPSTQGSPSTRWSTRYSPARWPAPPRARPSSRAISSLDDPALFHGDPARFEAEVTIPIRQRWAVPKEEVLAIFATAPVVNGDELRADLDKAVSQDLRDPYEGTGL